MQMFQDLQAWQRAHSFVLRVYRTTKELPQSENFGLILLLRRSATAMATRIAEGAGRSSNVEFAGELKKARAFGFELEYLLLLARDLGFLDEAIHEELSSEAVEIRKMLSGLLKRVLADP